MLSLQQCLSAPPMRLQHIFKKAYKHGLFNLNYDTYAHKACIKAACHEDIVMLHADWNVKKILPALHDQTMDFTNIVCGFYSPDLKGDTEYLSTQLLIEMEKGKVIYIVFNLSNYGLIFGEDENWYAHHCTAAILYPTKENEYNFYYINSHGEDMLLTNKFDLRISRKRTKRFSYDESIDLIWIKAYITHLRQLVQTHCDKAIKIHYDTTRAYNYYGPNLQSGDGHGVCFAFPLIIWYYLVNFYERPRICDSNVQTIIPSVKELLQQQDINIFIISCFIIFNKSYKKAFMEQVFDKKCYPSRHRKSYCMSEKENTYNKIHKYTQLTYEEIVFTKELESFIMKDGTRFIKKIASTIVTFLTQSYIKKIIS